MKINLQGLTSELIITNYDKLNTVFVKSNNTDIATVQDNGNGNYTITAIAIGTTSLTISAKNSLDKTIPVSVTFN